jgi:hypothetical protein
MCVEKILFRKKNKTLFQFEQAITAKTILVAGFYKTSFFSIEHYSKTLAIMDVTWFAFKSLAAARAFLFFMLAHKNLFVAGF